MLLASGGAAWATHTVVRDQARRLLNERSAEVGLIFATSVSNITSAMNSFLAVLRVTGASPASFARAATSQLTGPTASRMSVALLRPDEQGGYQVLAARGPAVAGRQSLGAERVRALNAASALTGSRAGLPVPTRIIGSGTDRFLGFAMQAKGIPGGPSNLLLYREFFLGPLSAGQQSSNAAFHELAVVLYAAPRIEPRQLLISTVGGPIRSDGAKFVAQNAGAGTWLLGVRAKSSLVGGVAENAWWTVLLAGIAISVLLATMIEFAIRRRETALSLYAAEHQQAEMLQRSLLPTLPPLPGLELAARYQAGGVGQQVGGDWFDAFPLDDGGVGFAIGDVIGHDVQAAAAMSQIRAALRAYAFGGAAPAQVLTQLDRLVMTFEVTQLVSVIYGVLGPVDGAGRRMLRFANAGHLPPLLQGPDGQVTVLSGGTSVVIGAPFAEARDQDELLVEAGSTFLLFTDGLVEAPNRSLSDSIPELARTVGQHQPGDGCDALCDRVLATRADQTLRDDVALLAVRLLHAPASQRLPADTQAREALSEVKDTSRSTAPLAR